ncbi:MAG: S8 family serine peptidase [Calditrichaeota bacterium]|nr:S8 family serine peptidase [Calditrichota bacterium]
MRRLTSCTITVILLTLSFVLSSTAISSDFDDRSWVIPGKNVMANEICIKIIPDIYPLDLRTFDGISSIGIPSMDAIADVFGVYKIEKYFRNQEPPQDPKITDLSCYYLVSFPAEFEPFILVDAYNTCSEIEFAELVPIHEKYFVPNDTHYEDQWHLDHCGLPGAWDVSHGSEDIIIGIVDSGLDMNIDGYLGIHEDFIDNIWHNLGEDLNDDDLCTWEDDFDDDDTDENGYADDFHGWNFSISSNWPDDEWGEEGGHGTHVAGCASPSTNNETGIAGPGFNCKIMVTAHYDPDDPDGGIIHGYQGVIYCAENGADLINLSWGSLSAFFQSGADAILRAQQEGAIIFAACGNANENDREQDQRHVYPCAYDGVIGVGAIDSDDNKVVISNYGDYTDIIAPGVDILSAWPRNTYESHRGTSMSSPIACGIGALMLSVKPDLDADELLAWMQRTAVDISDIGDNADYPGIQYRLDADFLLNSTHPKYDITEWSFIETEGNNDGYINRNETISINMALSNLAGYTDATNIVMMLENDDEWINIVRSEVHIGDLNAGDSHELLDDEYPVFTVHGSSPLHYTTFTLSVTSDEEFTQVLELPMIIRHPLTLLVDDDGGDEFEKYYQEDMLQAPIVFNTLNIDADGVPAQDWIDAYNVVVWETGNAEDPLSEAEQTLISGFLDQDGYLLISGQYIGDAIGETDFHHNYLKANHVEDNIVSSRLSGVADNPMTDGFDLLLFGDGGAENGTESPSAMEPINGAEAILHYTTEETDVGGIFYSGDYNLVYLGFALESVSGNAGTTTRREVIESILDYFHVLDVDNENTLPVIPVEFEIGQPHPNPFNSMTSVSVKVPEATEYLFEVIDLSGRRIATLHSGSALPGTHTYTWNAEYVPAGVYIFNLNWEQGSLARKVVLVK